jgi:acyl-CoA reductase-like NAD-dependent aldehyde dehydrogenase/isocitrate/isopropylmalate dehydrogenase/nicotinamidase-related amidase
MPKAPLKVTAALQWPSSAYSPQIPYVIGVLEGEGIGPEIIRASLLIVDTIQQCTDYRFELRHGGKIGLPALQESGAVLTPEVVNFCSAIFADKGAVLCGPGGGRFVYELRKSLDLYCKIVPIKPLSVMKNVAALKPDKLDADILIIRENIGGLYQGLFKTDVINNYQQASHTFYYDENQVNRILKVAIGVALQRRKKICVITKPGGIPSISALWKQCAITLTRNEDIELKLLEVDHAAYKILADAKQFDVIVAPNMFGDILADGAALLLGSRGLSYSANFGDNGKAVYQTGHGAAYDIAGQNGANPLGQIYSLAMMLHESFGLSDLSQQLKQSIENILQQGSRTADIMEPGCTSMTTDAFALQVAVSLRERLSGKTSVPVRKHLRPALLLIDLQNDFLDRLDNNELTTSLIANTKQLVEFCRLNLIPVLHIHTKIKIDGSDRMPHWIKNNFYACIENSAGILPPPELNPQSGEAIFYKRYFNAFGDNELHSHLQALGINTLIMAGLYLHGCIRSTALEAYEKNYTVWIGDDVVASSEPLHAELSRSWLQCRVATFLSAHAICQRLNTPAITVSQRSLQNPLSVANINNQWIISDAVPSIINYNPSNTAKILSQVASADLATVSNACEAAKHAWAHWRQTSEAERTALLMRWEKILLESLPKFVNLLVTEIGKPLQDAQMEMQRSLSHIRHSITLLQNDAGENFRTVKLRHRPAGCFAIITPWNNPVSTPVSKIAPAILFGNTVLWKPAPQTPLISMALMDSLIAAQIPPGIVNYLSGDETTARAIIVNPLVKAVSITGSISTGKYVSTLCGNVDKPLQAELGGNNACIIMADSDLPAVVNQLALSAFSFAGQRCTSTRRFIVEQSIVKEFETLLAKAIMSLLIGDPQLATTEIGPVINPIHLQRVQKSIRDAINQGARLVCGGNVPEGFKHGCWLEPTLLSDAKENSRIVQQETFGPVALIQTATDIEHAVRLANGVPHGLLASLLTNDKTAKLYFEDHIEAGILKLLPGPLMIEADVPFGGWKASGKGPPEHGEWDRIFYTQPQTVYG